MLNGPGLHQTVPHIFHSWKSVRGAGMAKAQGDAARFLNRSRHWVRPCSLFSLRFSWDISVLKSPVSHRNRSSNVSSGEMRARVLMFTPSNRIGHVQAVRDTRPASALNRRRISRFQRIDIRNRRRMFRPTAEIARSESLTKCPTNIRSKHCPHQNALYAAGLSVV